MAARAADTDTGGMQMIHARSPAATQRVFIVEDSPNVRQRLVAMMGETEGVSVVGEADTPKDAVAGILRTRPDWVVLDIQLIGGTGIQVLREVRAQVPETEFIVLTNMGNGYRRVCAEAGASHFVDKSHTGTLKDIISGSQRH